MSRDNTNARTAARPIGRTSARSTAPRAAALKTPRRTSAPGRRPDGAPSRAPRDKAAASRGIPDAVRDFVARHRAPVIAAVVALFAIVTLYGPACSLYQAWRDNGMLLAQQAQASEESTQLEGDISSLMTEDGIKDEARERGYVESGETRVVVEGLEDGDAEDAQGDASGTPWYLRVTDFIFQYEAQDAQS